MDDRYQWYVEESASGHRACWTGKNELPKTCRPFDEGMRQQLIRRPGLSCDVSMIPDSVRFIVFSLACWVSSTPAEYLGCCLTTLLRRFSKCCMYVPLTIRKVVTLRAPEGAASMNPIQYMYTSHCASTFPVSHDGSFHGAFSSYLVSQALQLYVLGSHFSLIF